MKILRFSGNESLFFMINGDKISNFWDRIAYFPQCIVNGLVGDKNLIQVRYISLLDDVKATNIGSPARRLNNMFWASVDWVALSKKLNGKVHVLDIGCGKGGSGNRFRTYLKRHFGSYSGLDLYKDESFPKEFTHIKDKAENVSHYIDNTVNLITSQSALEHIENDLAVLKVLTENLGNRKKSFLQIHLVPASFTLWTYLWHGWRQYSQRNLGLIASELCKNEKVRVIAIPLGGLKCHYIHFLKITVATLFKKILKIKSEDKWGRENTATSIKIREIVVRERNIKSLFPVFWVLMISNEEKNFEIFFEELKFLGPSH